MIKFVRILPVMLLMLHASPSMAQQGRFFEALYDVPIMEGMEEVPDQVLLFDKPDGKIALATGAVRGRSLREVSEFYDQTLPQMGWKKTGSNQYVRGNDRLTVRYAERAQVTAATFTLEPLEAGKGTK